MDKKAFRNQAAKKRSQLFDTLSQKAAADACLCRSFLSSGLTDGISTILTYVSFRDEADTTALIDHMLAQGLKVGVPVCGKKGHMDFFLINSRDELNLSAMGIPEPAQDEKSLVKTFENTLCIVPGMAFDHSGYRIGYGGGYYDRFLAAHREVVSAGICYQSLLYDHVPCEDHDISVDYIITEKGLLKIHG